MSELPAWLAAVKFNAQGLVCVNTVDADDNTLLMQAWMNAESLQQTVVKGEMVYFSRSRQQLWHKGEQSGHTQTLLGLWLDCDGDALLAKVRQNGGIACHTGRKSCFYRKLTATGWQDDPAQIVLKSADEIYERTNRK